MQTSLRGRAALELEEGVVLRAYRCPAGIWTIGAGLTSSSGVVKVTPGMQITAEEASRLLGLALARTFEPRVAKAMPGAVQHAFDAGVSFDFNTGAVHRASWVAQWRKKAARQVIWTRLMAWNKGGGRVLPGLVKRREREFAMLMDGVYHGEAKSAAPTIVNLYSLPDAQRAVVAEAFRDLGYHIIGAEPGRDGPEIRRFQADHDLTVDGIPGRATLSTLQRVLDARRKAPVAAVTATAAAPLSATGSAEMATGVPHSDLILVALVLIYGLRLAWSYRDVVASTVQPYLPRVAAFLRRF